LILISHGIIHIKNLAYMTPGNTRGEISNVFKCALEIICGKENPGKISVIIFVHLKID
jgi:hypothetical protein